MNEYNEKRRSENDLATEMLEKLRQALNMTAPRSEEKDSGDTDNTGTEGRTPPPWSPVRVRLTFIYGSAGH